VNTIGVNQSLPLAQTCATNKAEIVSFLETAGLT
jgi:hypothetical protein